MKLTRALLVLGAVGAINASAAPVAFAAPNPVVGRSTAVAAAPTTAAGWQALWSTLPYNGDGNWSTALPDGRSVWVTGDAIPRAGGTWASNTVTVVNGGGTWQTPNVLPDVDGVKSWLGPVVSVGGGRVVTLVSRIRPTPGVGIGFASVGTSVATLRVDSGAFVPVVERVTATPYSSTGVNWTAGVHADATYLYVFGNRQKAGTPEFDVYVARVPLASVHDWAQWRFWGGLSYGLGTPASVLTTGTDSAFSVRSDGTSLRLYTRHAGAHGEYVGRVGGAWSWAPRGAQAGYLPGSHPEARLASGKLLVTLNVAGGVGARFYEVAR